MQKIKNLIKNYSLIHLFKNKKKELLLFLISLILILFIIAMGFEIKLRIDYSKFHNEMKIKYEHREICMIYSDNPKLIYEFKPNVCGSNSHGFRDYYYNYSKKEGIFRIVLIGDSVAQGQGVDVFNESFGKVLEKKLNNFSENKKYEVIILAVSGYSTSQELVLLEEEAFKYEPDLIVWSYVMNDPANPVYHDVNGEIGRYFFRPKIYVLNYFLSKFFFLNENKKSISCEKEFHNFLHCVYWEDVQSNIARIGYLSNNKDVPVIFLIHPIFERNGYKLYSLTELHKDLSDEASKNNLIVLDVLDKYKYYDSNELKQHQKEWYDPWHPNAKGHEIIAEYLYKKILTYKYVKK